MPPDPPSLAWLPAWTDIHVIPILKILATGLYLVTERQFEFTS